MNTAINKLVGIKYPVFQGGMAWIADGRLAAAVSNAGGLGIISAMNAGADYLRGQIAIARSMTDKPSRQYHAHEPSCRRSREGCQG